MIIIHDEINGGSIDLKTLQKYIVKCIKKYQKDINDEKDSSRMLNLDETLDVIAAHQSALRYITEMEKIPFDVLVVVEREGAENK